MARLKSTRASSLPRQQVIEIAAVAVGLRPVAGEADRLAVVVERALVVAQALPGVAALVDRDRALRLALQHAVEIGDRLVVRQRAALGDAAIEQHVGRIGMARGDRAEIAVGDLQALGIALLQLHAAAQVARRREVGVERQRLRQVDPRIVVAAGIAAPDRAQHVELRLLRIGRDRAGEVGDRLLRIVGAVVIVGLLPPDEGEHPRIVHQIGRDALDQPRDRHRDREIVVVVRIVALQHQRVGRIDAEPFDRDVRDGDRRHAILAGHRILDQDRAAGIAGDGDAIMLPAGGVDLADQAAGRILPQAPGALVAGQADRARGDVGAALHDLARADRRQLQVAVVVRLAAEALVELQQRPVFPAVALDRLRAHQQVALSVQPHIAAPQHRMRRRRLPRSG